MKAPQLILAALLWLSVGSLSAQTCADSDRLTAAQIQAALGNQWFCAQKVAGDANSMWREYIPSAASGTFKECHSGLSAGPDPIDNNKGTFAIAGPSSSHGTITFDYGGGNVYSYSVCNGTTAGQYVFREEGSSSTAGLAVYISSCPSTGISNAQKNNCPP